MAIEARLTLNPDDYNAALEAAKKNTENLRKEIEKTLNFAVSMSTDSFRTFAACQTLIGWTTSSVKTGRDCLADRHS